MIDIAMIDIANDEFRMLRDVIRRRLGLYFDDSKEYLLRSRLQGRLLKSRVETFAQYCAYLDGAAEREAEWDELASVLSNNETYFFRERAQLDILAGPFLDAALSARRPLRIWSAACSSGEEPYSLAMKLLESGRAEPGAFSIVASDLSPRALERARTGFYRELAFRAMPPELIEKYFRPFEGGFFIAEPVKSMVRFSRVNLLDAHAVERVRAQDAIFCRNVLIYFDKPTQLEVAERLSRALAPGGALFLGHAESLLHSKSPLEPVITKNAVYYRQAGHAARH
ncbi:MAG TPA: protein-glutamate O-methyltransferase CheR [Candidatus Tyrphobacter sp.]